MPENLLKDIIILPPENLFSNLETFGRLRKDFSLVIMALELREECRSSAVVDTLFHALSWLQRKLETIPEHSFFRWQENIHAFLACFPSDGLATISSIFIDDKKEWLLKAMQDSPSFTKLTINDSRCLNNRFTYFLEQAKYLNEIHLELTKPLCMGPSFFALIAGLEKNTTLESVVLKGKLDDAECLEYLLETSNKSKSIWRLDFSECKMSEACYQIIKTRMENYRSLQIIADSSNLLKPPENQAPLDCISSTPAMPAFTPCYERRNVIQTHLSPEIIAKADAEIAAITKRMGLF